MPTNLYFFLQKNILYVCAHPSFLLTYTRVLYWVFPLQAVYRVGCEMDQAADSSELLRRIEELQRGNLQPSVLLCLF
jgi:hypothetical protein